MENNVEVLQKTKNCSPTPGHVLAQNYNAKRYMHPVFIAAPFTAARSWRQPACPSADEWVKMSPHSRKNSQQQKSQINTGEDVERKEE